MSSVFTVVLPFVIKISETFLRSPSARSLPEIPPLRRGVVNTILTLQKESLYNVDRVENELS
jgi:hypothetical protein